MLTTVKSLTMTLIIFLAAVLRHPQTVTIAGSLKVDFRAEYSTRGSTLIKGNVETWTCLDPLVKLMTNIIPKNLTAIITSSRS